MATATKPLTFGLSCPRCNEPESLNLDLANVTECRCSACDETFSIYEGRDLVRAALGRWDRLIAWVETARQVLATPMTSECDPGE